MPHPCPPGQIGGAFQPLTKENIIDITDAAFRLLEELGMGEVPDYLEEAALELGAHLNADGRLCYKRELVEEIIAEAPKDMTLYARDPNIILKSAVRRSISAQQAPLSRPWILTHNSIVLRLCKMSIILLN